MVNLTVGLSPIGFPLEEPMEIHWHLSEEDFFTGLPDAKEEFIALATRRIKGKGEFLSVLFF